MRIGIRSIGVLSAHGRGMDPLVEGIRSARCPRRPADGISFPGDSVPEASRFPDADREPGEAGAAARLLAAVDDAIAAACLSPAELQASDFALLVGSGGFLYASGAELHGRACGAIEARTPFFVRGPDWGVTLIAERFGLRGPRYAVSTGCSSSANALLLAAEMLARGRARGALVVGAEGLSAVTLGGFDSLMLLDPSGCHPFDRERGGLQIGEAVCAIVLASVPDNRPPSGGPGCMIIGGANRCDTHHLTSASPDGGAMSDVMREAMSCASVAASDIVAVKTHGTGSLDSDAAEAAALRRVFVDRLPPLLALKRHVGHTLGACGTLETAAMAGCLSAGFLPAAAGFETVDPELGVEPLRAARDAAAGCYLLNFFGFGGNYTSLVMRLD